MHVAFLVTGATGVFTERVWQFVAVDHDDGQKILRETVQKKDTRIAIKHTKTCTVISHQR